MANGTWFVVSVPKKEYEYRNGKVPSVTSASSKESLSKKSETSTVPNGGPKTPEPEAQPVKEKLSAKESTTSQTSLNKSSDKNSQYSDMVYFCDKRGPLEEMMKDALQVLGIIDAVWCCEKNDKFYQVFFPCDSGARCDHILRTLAARGIGFMAESTVAVLPCAVFYQERSILDEDEDSSESEPEIADAVVKDPGQSVKSQDGKSGKSMKGFKAMQQEFLKSVTARLTVAQVVESVRAGATLTFDFLLFVILAGLIAGFGLYDNSSVSIVASMLVSPIMGPIMALTFGAAIRDRSLLMLGIRTEAIGLSICLTLGLTLGIICSNFSEQWGANPFPTPEMAGRGQSRSLWMGVLIALPSGAGVALSILGGNAGSLVGVAISASLLPPVVNAGLLWSLAIIKTLQSYSHEMKKVVINGQTYEINEALIPPDNYVNTYRIEMNKECAILGIFSFLLTVVNIVCIIISAMVVLKVKEVAPNTSLNTTKRFWKQDIKIARDYNKTISKTEGTEMGQQFLEEWAACTDNFKLLKNLNGISPSEVLQDSKTQYQTLQDMLNDVEDDDVYRSILSYVPQRPPQDLSRRVTLCAWPTTQTRRVSDVESGGYSVASPVRRAINKKRHTRLNETGSPQNDETITAGATTAFQNLHGDPELAGVRLRHPPSGPSSPGIQDINPILRRSLQTAASPPYSLWPSRNKLRRLASSRFVVTPVEDSVPALPPRFRKSKHFAMESNI